MSEKRFGCHSKRARENKHIHTRERKLRNAEIERIAIPASLLVILAPWLSGCGSGEEKITFQVRTITGLTDLSITGLSPDQAVYFSPECTVITINGGEELLASMPEIQGFFNSVHINPAEGVEGEVWGTVGFAGTNANGNCAKPKVNVLLNIPIDTKPTICNEESATGNSVNLACDGDGQVQNGHEPVTSIYNGRAKVPMDSNQRTRELIIVDSAGNESTLQVSLPTNGHQVPGQISFNPATGKVQILMVFDGSGTMTLNGETKGISPGEGWIDVPEGGKGNGTIDFNGETTSFTIDAPDQPPPSIAVDGVSISGGQVHLSVRCQTTLGDNCKLKIDGQSVEIPGNGSLSQAMIDAKIGPARQAEFQACDTIRDCTTVRTTLPEYYPFRGNEFVVSANNRTKEATVLVRHPDEGDNIGNVTVGMLQKQGWQHSQLVKIWRKITGSRKLKEVNCEKTNSTANATLFSCGPLQAIGSIDTKVVVTEKGGEMNTMYGSQSYIDVPKPVQTLFDMTGFLITSVAIFTGISSFVRHMKNVAQRTRNRANMDSIKTWLNSPSNTLITGNDLPRWEKAILESGQDSSIYRFLIEAKNSIIELSKTVETYSEVDFIEMNRFIESCFEKLDQINIRQKDMFKKLAMERDTVASVMLWKLNKFLGNSIKLEDDKIFISQGLVDNEDFMKLIINFYRRNDQNLLWQMAGKSKPGSSDKEYPNLTREKMEYLILLWLDRTMNLKAKQTSGWTKWFTFFKEARGKKKPLGYEEAVLVLKSIKEETISL